MATPVAVICSANRPEMLHQSVLCVARQTEPCVIKLSVTAAEDVLPETRKIAGVDVLVGPRGSAGQRNRALGSIEHQPECVLFLDDDVELDANYVAEILACYRLHPEVAVVNGRNLAHGIYGAGTLTRKLAIGLIAEYSAKGPEVPPIPSGAIRPMATSYGCRMSMRGTLLGKVTFDERLVLYAFLEDVDFALRCRSFGTTVESILALGVHLEVASSRMGLKRRGYSEIINPLYLWSKREGYTLPRAVLGSVRRTLLNGIAAVRERDAERVLGNALGWMDAVRGRLEPERILNLP